MDTQGVGKSKKKIVLKLFPTVAAILGSEYCSGYIDLVGKWDAGFYCPSSEQTGSVFCCGSDNHKYCCTRKDEMMQEDMEGLSEVVGVMVGALTAILLLFIIFCVCCPWWPDYRKKNMDKSRGIGSCSCK